METARVNKDAIRKDLEQMGLTAERVSVAMGFSANYIADAIRRERVRVETIDKIERALFKEPGTYRLPDEPEPAKAVRTETEPDDLRELIAATRKTNDGIRELRDLMKELLYDIKGNTGTTKEYVSRIHGNVLKIEQMWSGNK